MAGWEQFIPFAGFGWALDLFFALFIVFLTLCVGIHEAAHAAVAIAFRISPDRIIIGCGPRALTWHGTVRGIPVSIGPIPIGGAVMMNDFDSHGSVVARVLTLLAGPVSTLLLGAAMLTAANGTPAALGLWHFLPHAPAEIASGIIGALLHPGAFAHEMSAGSDPASAFTPLGIWNFLGLIAVSIGLINLAPFPPLDGGTILLTLLDAVGLSMPVIRYGLLAIGIAGVALLTAPTAILLATVPWRGVVGSSAVGILIGLIGRQWMWYSHRRWGTAPPPPLLRLAPAGRTPAHPISTTDTPD